MCRCADAASVVFHQVQCITHFLKLPIEDDFYDQLEDPERGSAAPNSSGQERADAGASRLTQGQIPFSDHGNPVMAQVAASSVNLT